MTCNIFWIEKRFLLTLYINCCSAIFSSVIYFFCLVHVIFSIAHINTSLIKTLNTGRYVRHIKTLLAVCKNEGWNKSNCKVPAFTGSTNYLQRCALLVATTGVFAIKHALIIVKAIGQYVYQALLNCLCVVIPIGSGVVKNYGGSSGSCSKSCWRCTVFAAALKKYLPVTMHRHLFYLFFGKALAPN